MFENITIAERVTLAKEKTERVVGHLLDVLELHENNAIALYSSTLSAQIPVSFAAHAFNVFQQGLHEIEIVRLCALWDQAKLKKENIPTVIKLIDHPDVIESLAQGISAFWKGHQGSVPAFAGAQSPALFGEGQAQKARIELPKVLADGRKIMASPKLTSIMNWRDKHLAHLLLQTWLEQKSGPIDPMKYRDEHELLDATVPIVDTLHCWVNGSNIAFDDFRRIARKNAEALWTACKFKIDP
jgi:AbiU2